MRRRTLLAVGLACTLACPTLASAQSVQGHWTLLIRDTQQRERVAAIVRLDPDAASSCMGGDWQRVVVESVSRSDDAFFPAAQPLSWQSADGTITLGRTGVCDSYRLLKGGIASERIEGRYVGWGKRHDETLGDFLLQRRPD